MPGLFTETVAWNAWQNRYWIRLIRSTDPGKYLKNGSTNWIYAQFLFEKKNLPAYRWFQVSLNLACWTWTTSYSPLSTVYCSSADWFIWSEVQIHQKIYATTSLCFPSKFNLMCRFWDICMDQKYWPKHDFTIAFYFAKVSYFTLAGLVQEK